MSRTWLSLVATLFLFPFTANAYANNRCLDAIDSHASGIMLNLAYCDLHPNDLNAIALYLTAHPALTALNLEGNTRLFDASNASVLTENTHLKYLSVINTMVNTNGDNVTRYLVKIPNLKLLILSDNNLTDDSIDAIMQSQSLLALTLDNNPRISTMGLVELSQHRTITQLNLNEIPLDDDSLKALSLNTHLTHISLGYDNGFIHHVSDDSLMSFAKNPNLVEFSLSHTNLSLAFVKALAQSRSLRSLALPYDDLDINSVKAISLNKMMTSLDLSGNEGIYTLDHAAEKIIASMSTLTCLSLNHIHMVDLDQLARMNKLAELHLDGDRFIGSFASFKKHPSLKVLSMVDTYPGANALSEYMNIARIMTLTSLDVSRNYSLTDDAIVAFTQNPSINTLTINKEYQVYFSSRSTEALAMDPYLKFLSVSLTSLPNVSKLLNNRSLQELDVSFSWGSGDKTLGTALSKARYLRTVYLSYDDFSPETRQAIEANTKLITIIDKPY